MESFSMTLLGTLERVFRDLNEFSGKLTLASLQKKRKVSSFHPPQTGGVAD